MFVKYSPSPETTGLETPKIYLKNKMKYQMIYKIFKRAIQDI